jgi:hypothetical protein
MRTWLVVVLLVAACDAKSRSNAQDKVEKTVDKVDKVMDKDDKEDVASHVSHATAEIQAGRDPAEDCSWQARQTETDATRTSLAELRLLCTFDAPLARAKAAVVRAEKAKAEQPDAPTLTECQSDDWPAIKAHLDTLPNAADARWTELKTRWAKVCPDQK